MDSDPVALERHDCLRHERSLTRAEQIFSRAGRDRALGTDRQSASPATDDVVLRTQDQVSDARDVGSYSRLQELNAAYRVHAFTAQGKAYERKRRTNVQPVREPDIRRERHRPSTQPQGERFPIERFEITPESRS